MARHTDERMLAGSAVRSLLVALLLFPLACAYWPNMVAYEKSLNVREQALHRNWDPKDIEEGAQRYDEIAASVDHAQWYVDTYGFGAVSSPLLVQPDSTFQFSLSQTADTFYAAELNTFSVKSADAVANLSSSGANLSLSYGTPSTGQAAPDGGTAAAPAPVTVAAPTLPALGAPQTTYATGMGPVSDPESALGRAARDVAMSALYSLIADPTKIAKFKNLQVLFGFSMVSVNPGWHTRKGYAVDLALEPNYQVQFARVAVRDGFLAMKGNSPLEDAALHQLQSCVADTLTTDDSEHYMEENVEELIDEQPELTDGGVSPCSTRKAGERKNDCRVEQHGHSAWDVPGPFNGAQFEPYVYRDRGYDYNPSPMVAAVSPMADAQSLDLQSSLRAQQTVALQIAGALTYAGYKAQAQAFLDFAKQHASDTESLTNNVVANAYSLEGGIVGFHVGPRVQADPQGRETTSQEILGPQSFPTLLLIGVDNDDLRPRVLVLPRNGGGSPRCFVVERAINFVSHLQWLPLTQPCKHRGIDNRQAGDWDYSRPPPGDHGERCGQDLFSEREHSLVMRGMNIAREELDKNKKGQHTGYEDYMNNRLNDLSARLEGSDVTVNLPVEVVLPPASPPPNPSAENVSPATVILEQNPDGTVVPKLTKVMLAGTDLDQIDLTKVTIVTNGTVQWAGASGAAQTAPSVKLVGGKALVMSVLVASDQDQPFVFKLPVKASAAAVLSAPVAVNLAKNFVVQHRSGPNNTLDESVTYSRDIPTPVMKALIEKNKPCCPPCLHEGMRIDLQTEGCCAKGVQP